MYAVGDVIHMQLLREITGPYRAEHLLAYLAVEPAYAVCLLAGVERKDTHREFLGVVVRIDAAHADQVMPFDTQFAGIFVHVFVEQAFLEIVVAGGNRGVAGVQTACADYFLRLVEGQTLFLYQVHQTLQAHQCGVTLVAVIYIFLDA